MSWTNEEINEIYEKVMQKARTDEEFRQELLVNPNQAIAKLTNKALPDGFAVKVLENDPNYNATFVLPDLSTGELDLDDLDNVAGGLSVAVVISLCAVAVQVK